jgi:hypothetical protein
VIGFRSRRKVQPTDQAGAVERRQSVEAHADAQRQLREGDARIARLRQQAGQVDV